MIDLEIRKHVECTLEEKLTCVSLINQMINLSRIVRQDGILSLEKIMDTEEDFLLRKGLLLLISGCRRDAIEDVLGTITACSFKTGVELLRQLIIGERIVSIVNGDPTWLVQDKLTAFLGEDGVLWFEDREVDEFRSRS